MAKKYLSLQEAANRLGISEDALKKARESGDVRGFADRGNWKFREEDIDEYGRSLQADSNPEVPLFAGNDIQLELGDDDNVLADDDDAISEQPTVIRKPGSDVLADDEIILNLDEGASDSGVRLVLDAGLTEPEGESSVDIPLQFGDSNDAIGLDDSSDESSVDIPLQFGDSSHEFALDDDPMEQGDSDSDVRLVGLDDEGGSLDDASSEAILSGMDSDSDVRLLGQTAPINLKDSDSDVRLIRTDSDSDVQLVKAGSDSDVRLLGPRGKAQPDSDSDVSLIGDDASASILDDGSGIRLNSDSGVRLEAATDSGISLDMPGDSGLSLEMAADSGISLDLADDSGIALDVGTDSDIKLAPDEEGITLDTAGDSGISLDMPADSGISLDSPSMEATVSMLKVPKRRSKDDPTLDTSLQIPTGGGEKSDFELGSLEGDSTSDTSVLLFDDEDADETIATKPRAKAGAAASVADETFELQDDADDSLDEDFADGAEAFDEEFEDVADDSEFMADEADFDEGFGSGEGQSEFAGAPGAVRVAAVEQEWGIGVFLMAMVSSVVMLLAGFVMLDLVRFLWKAEEYGGVSQGLINIVGK